MQLSIPKPNLLLGLLLCSLALPGPSQAQNQTIAYESNIPDTLTAQRDTTTLKIFPYRKDTIQVSGSQLLKLTYPDGSYLMENQMTGYKAGTYPNASLIIDASGVTISYSGNSTAPTTPVSTDSSSTNSSGSALDGTGSGTTGGSGGGGSGGYGSNGGGGGSGGGNRSSTNRTSYSSPSQSATNRPGTTPKPDKKQQLPASPTNAIAATPPRDRAPEDTPFGIVYVSPKTTPAAPVPTTPPKTVIPIKPIKKEDAPAQSNTIPILGGIAIVAIIGYVFFIRKKPVTPTPE